MNRVINRSLKARLTTSDINELVEAYGRIGIALTFRPYSDLERGLTS